LHAVALGAGSEANGIDSTATGTRAQATATGASAFGGDGNIDGFGAQATGSFSTAIGADSVAGFNNSTAIGAGAATARANQQSFGTASNTYTMAGITSQASKTAQGTPTHLVTSNVGGDLAAYTPSELGLATTADLAGFATKGDVQSLQSKINRLGQRDSELTEGIAAVVAVAQPILLPGQHFAVRAGWGGYDGSNAVGISAAGVLANNLLAPGSGTFTLDGGVGFGTDEGEVVGRAGGTFGW
jgi:hypothetical protein